MVRWASSAFASSPRSWACINAVNVATASIVHCRRSSGGLAPRSMLVPSGDLRRIGIQPGVAHALRFYFSRERDCSVGLPLRVAFPVAFLVAFPHFAVDPIVCIFLVAPLPRRGPIGVE